MFIAFGKALTVVVTSAVLTLSGTAAAEAPSAPVITTSITQSASAGLN